MSHVQKHKLNDTNHHLGGTAAAPGKFTLVGTTSAGVVGELTVEVQDPANPVAGEIVRRGTGGHVHGPAGNATGQQYITFTQAQTLASGGPWRGTIVGDYPDHTSPSVENLAVGDKVVNTTDNKIYTVEDVINGNKGNLVTWSAGVLPDTNVIYLNLLKQSEFFYDHNTDEWVNLGSSGHSRRHDIESINDHFTNTNRTGVLYSSNTQIHVLLTVEELSGTPTILPCSPLIAQADGTPTWGKLRIAHDKINAAGADPAYTDLGALSNQTLAIVETATSIFLGYKRSSTNSGFVELTP